MLVMAFPPVEKRVIAGDYVVAEHKPNGRGSVNMQPPMLHRDIPVSNRLIGRIAH
ncbi:MAG: hypothetical protein ACTHNH_13065 [Mesorhizobium sp.]